MSKQRITGALLAVGLFITGLGVTADCHRADFVNPEGRVIGHAWLSETPNGVLVKTNVSELPEGWHGFHIHEKGACTPPDFTSAGGHFNPEQSAHGFEAAEGPHAGDLPNVYVGSDGMLTQEFMVHGVTLSPSDSSLLDDDGSALVIHEKADDYSSQPSGDAGGRIACGVIQVTSGEQKPAEK